jgi:hypothetical protein
MLAAHPAPPARRLSPRPGGAPLRRHPGMSAGGHFTGTPTRSLHARRAGAPEVITSRCPKSAASGCHNAPRALRRRRPARRPGSVTRPPAGGWGCARRGGRCVHARRRAATSPGCRRAAGTRTAQLRRGIPSGWPKSAGPRCITRFAHLDARSPFLHPPPAVPRRDRWRADRDARGGAGAASTQALPRA